MAGKRLTGKFTEEEFEIIKQVKEKMKVNDNQLVRGGVNLMISIVLVQDFLGGTSFAKLMKPMVKDMDKFVKSPEFETKLEKIAKRISKKDIKEIEERAKELDKKTTMLTKKKKVGRPKIKKSSKKRGRPKGS